MNVFSFADDSKEEVYQGLFCLFLFGGGVSWRDRRLLRRTHGARANAGHARGILINEVGETFANRLEACG